MTVFFVKSLMSHFTKWPGVNFINILHAPFGTKSLCKAFFYLHFGFLIFWGRCIGLKAVCKMLMKLTTGNLNIKWPIILLDAYFWDIRIECVSLKFVKLLKNINFCPTLITAVVLPYYEELIWVSQWLILISLKLTELQTSKETNNKR